MKKTRFLLVVIAFFNLKVESLKPNILFLMVDDLRPALGLYGDMNAHTAHIDKLAENSFVFNNVFAQQALCAPSRNSLLTSRRPDSLHLYDFYSYWRDTVGNFTTIPQIFKENGYFTKSIGKIFHPGKSSNFTDDALYSWSTLPFHPSTEKYKEAKVCVDFKSGKLSRNLLCPVVVQNQPGGTLPDLESYQATVDFLNNKNKICGGKPYFLAVGFHKPHIPLKFPVEYLNFHPLENVSLPSNRWKSAQLPSVAWNPWLDVRNRDDINKLNISFPFGNMPDPITRQIIQNYNAATTYIDDLIGGILERINKTDTLVVLTSDHGWSRGEHGEFSKFSNFDVSTKVPLLIHVPNLSKNKIIVNNLAELVDIFPTLVDLTQITEKSIETCAINGNNSKLCTEGKSLLSVMMQAKNNRNVSVGKNAVFSQYPRPGPFPTKSPDSDRPRLNNITIMGYSMRTSRYRYTEWIKFNHSSFLPDWSQLYGKELYDHLIDPDENMNLSTRSEMTEIIKKLRTQLILGWRYA